MCRVLNRQTYHNHNIRDRTREEEGQGFLGRI